MQSMLTPWMGGRACAVAPVTTQAGMGSMLAPWMGGRAAALAVVPPPPPPPTPTPLSGSSGPGGGGGGGGWYDHDHSLRKLLDAAWERGRLKRVAPALEPTVVAEDDVAPVDVEPRVETVHHHHWWVVEKEVEVDRPVFIDNSVTTLETRTVTSDVSPWMLALAAGLALAGAVTSGLCVYHVVEEGPSVKALAYMAAAVAAAAGASAAWERRAVVREDTKVEVIEEPRGFARLLRGANRNT